jgi:HEAT repeat protein
MLSLMALGSGSVSAQSQLERQIDSMFVIASSGRLAYRGLTEPALDAIAALGVDAVPHLIDKFTTQSPRERWTVIWILQRIGSPAVPDLLRALGRDNDLVVKRVCWALGDIGDTAAVEGLVNVSSHASWWVRDEAIGALGDIGDRRAAPAIIKAMTDSIGQVRKSAAVAAGRLKLDESAGQLLHLLGDDFYGARMTAIGSLSQLDTALLIELAADSVNSANKLLGNLLCRLLGEIGTDAAIEILMTQVASPDPDRRAHAGVALAKADPLDNCDYRRLYLDEETDRLVRLKIESQITAVSEDEP